MRLKNLFLPLPLHENPTCRKNWFFSLSPSSKSSSSKKFKFNLPLPLAVALREKTVAVPVGGKNGGSLMSHSQAASGSTI